MELKLTDGRPEDALKTHEAQSAFLLAALKENDPEFFAHCIGIVAKANKMSGIIIKVQHSANTRKARRNVRELAMACESLAAKFKATPAPITARRKTKARA